MASAAGKRLPTLIASYSAGAIRRMAEVRGLRLAPGTRKAAAVEALSADAVKPESVKRAVEALSPKQRKLLDLLLLYPGEIPTDFVMREAAKSGLVKDRIQDRYGYSSYYYNYSYRTKVGDPSNANSTDLADLVAALSERVLALTTLPHGGSVSVDLGLAGAVTVPGEIRPVLVALVSPGLPVEPEAPASVSAADPRAVHRSLFLLWSAVRSKRAGITQAGLVRKTDARRLGQALGVADKDTRFDSEQDLGYLYFTRQIATRAGLLTEYDSNLEAGGRERLREFLSQPWPQRTLSLLHSWIEIASLSFNGESASSEWHPRRALPISLRMTPYMRYMALLAGLPDAWVEIPAFVHWMRLHHFGFLALGDDDPLAAHDLGTALYYEPFGRLPSGDPWDGREGRAIRESLTGALHWLGIVELGGYAGGKQAFRLTEVGRAMLAALAVPDREAEILAPLAEHRSVGRVVVQPNFQVLVVGDVPDETLFALSEITELVRAEQAIEFKLTRESVYDAQQAGWTPLAILDLLRGATGAPLAQNVERSILDWAAAHERVVIRRDATLLAVRLPEILDRLAADPKVAPLLGERLLPTLALVSPGTTGTEQTVVEMSRFLVAAGELPSVSDVGQDKPTPSFAFDAEGGVDWKGALPDLRLLGLLASLTRPGPDGRMLLDERAVRATAVSRHWLPSDVRNLLDELAAWHNGPLPAPVVQKIKMWSGYQGRAMLREVTILTVDRPEILADLLADPTLGPLLAPLRDAGMIAVVSLAPQADRRTRAGKASASLQDLDAVREALLAQGFTLSKEE
ncbi:MAG: helicase-associated domain-containing protein [Chloroflexia bacterium]